MKKALRKKAVRSLRSKGLKEAASNIGITEARISEAIDKLDLPAIKLLDRTKPTIVALGLCSSSNWSDIMDIDSAVEKARGRSERSAAAPVVVPVAVPAAKAAPADKAAGAALTRARPVHPDREDKKSAVRVTGLSSQDLSQLSLGATKIVGTRSFISAEKPGVYVGRLCEDSRGVLVLFALKQGTKERNPLIAVKATNGEWFVDRDITPVAKSLQAKDLSVTPLDTPVITDWGVHREWGRQQVATFALLREAALKAIPSAAGQGSSDNPGCLVT
jgi:hypothetical protein